jgi:hypothetical protein
MLTIVKRLTIERASENIPKSLVVQYLAIISLLKRNRNALINEPIMTITVPRVNI